MGKAGRLGVDTAWLSVSRFGSQALMVAFTILIARRLGSTGFGEYAFIAAIVFLGNVLTTFGTDLLLIREIAGRDDLSRLPDALATQLLLSCLFIAGIMVSAPFLLGQSPGAQAALRVYSLALIPLAFFTVFTTVIRGKQFMDAYTLLNLTVAFLQVALVWLSFHSGDQIVKLAGLLLITQVVAALLAGLICQYKIPTFWRSWRFSLKATRQIFRMSASIALLSLIGVVYQKLTVYMLSFSVGANETGWFSAALRVVEASKLVHIAAFTALYPAMAYVHTKPGSPIKGKNPFSLSWKLLLSGAAAIAVGLFFFADPLIHLLYGMEFEPSVSALKILTWSIIPYALNTYLLLALMSTGGENVVALVLIIALFVLAVTNGWFITVWGLPGACLAVVLAEAVQLLVYFSPVVKPARNVIRLL